jgi:hypothetical protein
MPDWVGIVVYFVPPPIGLAHYLVLRRRMADRRLRWLAFWCYFGPRLPAEPMKAPFVLAAKLFPLVFVGTMLVLAVIHQWYSGPR